MNRGNSFANGGNSMANGPCAQYPKNGWPIRPATSWDLTEGRDPE